MRVAEALATEPMPEDPATVLEFGEYRLDLAGHSLTDRTGREIPLTHGEFGLFRVFVRRSGRVLSRDQLLQLLSGRDAEAYDRSIDMQVVRLRRKIEPDPKRPTLIVTVPNSGYKFAATVRQIEAPAVPKPDPAEVGPGDAERRHVTALAAEVSWRRRGRSCRTIRRSWASSSMPGATTPAAVVARHGGVVAESRVREVLAYFGYPVAQEHAAERALHAALALVERSPEGERRLPAGLIVRAGVASGLVVADPMARCLARRRRTPRECRPLPSLVRSSAASARRLAAELFAYRDLGPLAVRGVADLVQAWQVLGPSAHASRSEMLYAAAAQQLIGRDEELGALLRAWRQASSGHGRLVLLTGEPGIGKSRLLAALERVHRRRTACQPAVLLFAAAPRQHVASCRGSLGAGGRFRARRFERGAFAQA